MTVKIRAKIRKGKVEVKGLVKHPMETGQRKDKKTGKLIPAHHITDIKVSIGNQNVISGQMSAAVSKNPFVGFQLNGKKGDTIEISYVDNKGQSGSGKAKVR